MKIGDIFWGTKNKLRSKISRLENKLEKKKDNTIARNEIFRNLKKYGLVFYIAPRDLLEGYNSGEVSFDPVPFDHFPHNPDTYVANCESMITGYGWTANTGSITRDEFWYGINDVNRLSAYIDNEINLAQILNVAKNETQGKPGSSFTDYDKYQEEELRVIGNYGKEETNTVRSNNLKQNRNKGNCESRERGIESWEDYRYLIRSKTGIFTSRDEVGFGAYSHGRSLTIFENNYE